jgi:cbb3-type cytochrome oxidase subunit 3
MEKNLDKIGRYAHEIGLALFVIVFLGIFLAVAMSNQDRQHVETKSEQTLSRIIEDGIVPTTSTMPLDDEAQPNTAQKD